MPEITEAQLKKHMKDKSLLKVYFLYGNEGYLKRFYAEKLAEGAVTELKDLNLHRFDGSVKIDELSDAVEALPVMSERSCVVVCDYNIDAAPANEQEKLKQLLSDLPESCVLIFWYDLVEVNPAKSAKVKSVINLIKSAGCTVVLNRRDESELVQILCKRAGKNGCSLQPTTARYLIELCGNDLTNLFSELDKICIYVGKGAITIGDIDATAVKAVDTSVFLLAKAVNANNPDRAFGLIDELFAQKVEPIAILGALSSAYVDMYRAKLAEADGLRAESIADDFGYKNTAFRLKNASNAAKRVNVSTLRSCLDQLRQTDVALKSTALDSRTLLEKTLMRLMMLMSK